MTQTNGRLKALSAKKTKTTTEDRLPLRMASTSTVELIVYMCDSKEGYRGGGGDRQRELVFKTELAERLRHGNGCCEGAAQICS